MVDTGRTCAYLPKAMQPARNARPMPVPDFDEIKDTFAFLDDWEDRYRYIIELGNQLTPYPEANKTEATKVKGCVSQVWLSFKREKAEGAQEQIHLTGDSDAHIVRGLMAIVFSIFSGKTPQEILDTDVQKIFESLELKDHISPQRSNGLNAMVQRIQQEAATLNAAS